MELTTKKFGKKIKAATPSKDEWQRWLSAIDAVISAIPWTIPKEKKRREALSEISSYLFNFKEAFRNKTMHPEKNYTREQAKRALDGAQSFLDGLARRVFKVKI